MIDLDDIELVANKLDNLVESGTDTSFMDLPGSVIHEVGELRIGIIGTTTAMDTTNAFGEADEFDVIPAVEREVAMPQGQGADSVPRSVPTSAS